jgi:site-specific DNA-methyltransferase (adenine-specific)
MIFLKLNDFELNKVYEGNSLNLMKKIPESSIDLIVTDPPFAINFKGKPQNYNRTASRVLEGYAEIPQAEYPDFSSNWIRESYRVLKDSGSMYVFSGWTNLRDVLNAIAETKFTLLNHIIWKYQFGVFTKKKFVTSHYHVLLCVKNPKKTVFNKIDHYPEDVWVINREYWHGEIKTPTKLPMAVVKKAVLYSSNEGGIVLDPFMGSGTTGAVAKATNRKFIGFEIVPAYAKFANARIAKVPEGLSKWTNGNEF